MSHIPIYEIKARFWNMLFFCSRRNHRLSFVLMKLMKSVLLYSVCIFAKCEGLDFVTAVSFVETEQTFIWKVCCWEANERINSKWVIFRPPYLMRPNCIDLRTVLPKVERIGRTVRTRAAVSVWTQSAKSVWELAASPVGWPSASRCCDPPFRARGRLQSAPAAARPGGRPANEWMGRVGGYFYRGGGSDGHVPAGRSGADSVDDLAWGGSVLRLHRSASELHPE